MRLGLSVGFYYFHQKKIRIVVWKSKGKSAIKEMLENNIFSISAYLKLLNGVLNSFEARIVGEVSEIKISSVGHVYFSLKDKKDKSDQSCVIWSYDYKLCGVQLKEGLEIIAGGVPDVYPPTGRLSFKDKDDSTGRRGGIEEGIRKLKKKLEDEGLFALKEGKRRLPSFHPEGGNNNFQAGSGNFRLFEQLGRFGFQVKFVDSRVEGLGSGKDLLNGVKTGKEA